MYNPSKEDIAEALKIVGKRWPEHLLQPHERAGILESAYIEAIVALRQIAEYTEALDECYMDNEIWGLCRQVLDKYPSSADFIRSI